MRFTLSFLLAFALLCAPAFASNLSINDLHVSVSYPAPYDRYSDTRDDNAQDLVDGADIPVDIYPGSIVEFVFEVANLYDNDEDIDIENIVVTLTVEDLDDGGDVEVESEEFDLGAEEEYKPRITFTVPEKVEDMEYIVILEAEGESENGTTQSVENTYTLTVKKDSHDLKLISTSISPQSVSCDREIRLSATISNVGRLVEDNAAVEISSPALGLLAYKANIELSEDPFLDENDFTYSVPFTVPSSVAAGTYDVTFKALYEEKLALHVITLPLTVSSCGTQKPAEPIVPEAAAPATPVEEPVVSSPLTEEQNAPAPSTPSITPSSETPSAPLVDSAPIVTSSVEKSATSSTAFKALFVILNLLVLGIIIAVVGILLSKRTQ